MNPSHHFSRLIRSHRQARMLTMVLGTIILSLLAAPQLHAQWRSESYTLQDGWNAIYLHGEANHATMEVLFPNPNVLEVWRWNTNPDQVQFIENPSEPSPGTPEWSVWVRGGGANTLTTMTGQAAYLVKCTGAAVISLVQRPLAPDTTWVRNGANLLGFPSSNTSGSFPLFSNYFDSFPAAISANVKIYKYGGGEFSATNPLQIFAPSFDHVDRNQAYWFSTEVVENFYAPVQVTFSSALGLDFGKGGSVITAQVVNRTSADITLTLTSLPSAAAPAGEEAVTGDVPLTRRVFSGGLWTETPIASAPPEVIPANSTVELNFGIDRSVMGGAVNTLHASLLQLTDDGKLFDIILPVRARKTSLAGLWVGEARVTAVESKPDADAVTPTGRAYPLRYLLHVDGGGTARLLSQVFLGPLAADPHEFGICTKESGLNASEKANATRIVAAHLPLDRVIDAGSGSVAVPGTLNRTITIPWNDPTNPFVHQYHPDHDNKDPKGNALGKGFESYTIEREVTFTFTDAPPPGSSITTGWGSSVIGGTYAETLQGLHKDSTGVGTGDGLHITGTFELRRVSEIDTISVNP